MSMQQNEIIFFFFLGGGVSVESWMLSLCAFSVADVFKTVLFSVESFSLLELCSS